jgi:2,3-dihydroxybiphenyl 1,2-dioxygenase
MASVTQLGYLGIGVSDLTQWRHFAANVLGLEVSSADADEAAFLRMDEYHHRFILTPGGDDVAFVGWEVRDQAALNEVAARLREDGFEVTKASPEEARTRRVVEYVKLNDSSGIPTEIYYGPLMTFEHPFKSPRPHSGFVTGELGMGHIVVRVDDSAKSLRFYRDLLGLRVSDFIEMRSRRGGDPISLTFMHCNPRHHSIAFGVIPAQKRLMHFMLQCKHVDDVGTTYYLCQDQGVEISGTLGRHTNDHMMSFYMRSPSGFEVEYGWGARIVDDATWQVQKHEAPSIWGHRGSLAPSQRKPAPL